MTSISTFCLKRLRSLLSAYFLSCSFTLCDITTVSLERQQRACNQATRRWKVTWSTTMNGEVISPFHYLFFFSLSPSLRVSLLFILYFSFLFSLFTLCFSSLSVSLLSIFYPFSPSDSRTHIARETGKRGAGMKNQKRGEGKQRECDCDA